jgi:hypothetical protein
VDGGHTDEGGGERLGGSLGSRGLTIMHFKAASEMTALEDGSTNANFSSDFSPSASLPPATTRCSSYEDILDALHGLIALSEDVWYTHLLTTASCLRTFVPGAISSREQKFCHGAGCFALHPTSPDAVFQYGGDNPAGNAAVPADLLTLRSGMTIHPPLVIQPPLTIQSHM